MFLENTVQKLKVPTSLYFCRLLKDISYIFRVIYNNVVKSVFYGLWDTETYPYTNSRRIFVHIDLITLQSTRGVILDRVGKKNHSTQQIYQRKYMNIKSCKYFDNIKFYC